MGCHTWYRKPLVKGKENVQKYLRDKIETMRKKDWWNEECELEALVSLESIELLDVNMSEYLLDTVCVDNTLIFIDNEPVIFIAADGFDTDEPRIGGYPDTVVKSTEEMFEAMEKGLINWEGKHFNFHIEKEREDYVRNNIIEFFKAHPDGIIEFG